MRFIHKVSLFLLLPVFGVFLCAAPANAQSDERNELHVDSTHYHDLDFRTVGPARGGRVTAVEGHRAHPHTFYMGGAGGSGVWRTTDYGHTWTNISDGHGFKSTSIGAIEVADSDTSVIYVGTGTDGIRANVTTGRGLYKSTDAGESWRFMGLEDAGQIGAVEAHPENPDLVYVAALGHAFGENPQRGVFRSRDGGETWEKVLFLSDSTGAIDLELNPENPDEIYAAMWRAERKPWTIISGAAGEDGLYKSTDGGDTWNRMNEGLPQGLFGKADFAVTPADPDRIYALVEAPGKKQGLYRSDDRGESWRQVSDTSGIMNRPFYFTNIDAHPTHPDTVYVGNVSYWVSEDGGETFERRGVTHGDVHDLWINPDNPKIQVQGNDGGATVTLDGGNTWTTQYNQPTAELYQVNVDERFPYWLYAGQQDYSTIAVPSLPPAESAVNSTGLWHMVGGCETGPAVPQRHTGVVFSNCKGRFGRYSMKTGEEQEYWVGGQYMYGRNPAKLKYRFQRVAPIEISPHDSSVVYHGSQYVHRTTDGGITWETISPDLTAFKPQYQMASGKPITRDITGEEHYSTLYSIQVSPRDPDVIWVGANDGPVHVTRDGGETWTDITPDDLPPNGRVDAIEVSPHAEGTAYIAVVRRYLDDFSPYIYRTNDFGNSWKRLTTGDNGIPADYPTRVVREDPNRRGLLYAGTDFGLFVSFTDGSRWQPLQLDLPVTPITDIRIHRKDLVLSTMGRGFWILDDLTILHRLDERKTGSDTFLIAPRDTYRMRYWGGRSRVPEYPQSGANVDFYLSEIPEGEVKMEIMDATGNLIRRFIGVPEDYKRDTPSGDPDRRMMTPKTSGIGAPDTFTVHTGHNRFTWGLRYPGNTVPAEEGNQYFGTGRGPLATPGSYDVRLSVGDWSQTERFNIKMDPRVKADGVTKEDLRAQLDLNLKIRDAIGLAEKISAEIDSTRKRFTETDMAEERGEREAAKLRKRLDRMYNRLETSDKGSYPPPMLIDQLQYLNGMTASADQRPGNDAYTRFDTLRERLEEIRMEWKKLEEELDMEQSD